MKTVLLAGGFGTRLAEHTDLKPKPMIEIGPHPILWHIMSTYDSHGYRDFIVACGYKSDVVKSYFDSYYIHHSDYTVNLRDGTKKVLSSQTPDWTVSVVDTGLHTMTGGRVRRLAKFLDSTFMVTYGDGLANVDIGALVAFHKSHGKLATVTAVHPLARFGALSLDGDRVVQFAEKPQASSDWINGGFFVFEPQVIDFIDSDATSLEREPLERLAQKDQLRAFKHTGFWQPMDTLREKKLLEGLWESGQPPWAPGSPGTPRAHSLAQGATAPRSRD